MELKIPGTGPSAAAAIAPNSGPVTIETHSRFRRKPEVGAVAAGTAGRPGGRSEGFGATGLRLGMSLGPWFGAVRAAFGASGLLPASSPLPPVPAPTQAMAAPADASLLSAELVADDGEEEALRRLLLQVTQDDEEPPPPTDPSRAVTPAARCPAPSQYVEVAEHLSQHPGVLLPQAAGAELLWLGLSEEQLVLKGEGGGSVLELPQPRPVPCPLPPWNQGPHCDDVPAGLSGWTPVSPPPPLPFSYKNLQ
ncbi:uncharacterized protein LOC110361176 isoform X7 [Columba livia]|uniref:uncharacterized protein LOC110361176 isoform X7 n=1 Tax=Columba livia TaxID=8932 RepID=UPI0031BA8FEB